MPVAFESVDMRWQQPPAPQEKRSRWAYVIGVAGALALAFTGAVGYQGARTRPEPPATVLAAPCPEPPAQPKEAPFEMAAGAPLSRREIVLLLQSAVPLARLNQIIEKRGVDFVNGAESAGDILKAGGTHELNGIIALSYRNASLEAQKAAYRPAAVVPAPKPAAETPSVLQGQSLLR